MTHACPSRRGSELCSAAAASLGVRIARSASVSLPVPPRHRLQACGARAYDVPLPALLARRLAPQTSHLVEEPHASTSSEVTFGVSVVGTAPPVRRRSEERRGGKGCVRTCRSWWSLSH